MSDHSKPTSDTRFMTKLDEEGRFVRVPVPPEWEDDSLPKTRVVHVHDNVPGAVYIGRANRRRGLSDSVWANPFKIGKPRPTRRDVVEQYSVYIHDQFAADPRFWMNELCFLAGKPLACWCRHQDQERSADTLCHADVLIALIEKHGLEPTP